MNTRKQKTTWFVLFIAGLWFLGLAFLTQPAKLTVSALPPRPEPDPEPILEMGAYIKLEVENAPTGLWTMVQWKDGLDNWHNVDGWQGPLNDDSTIHWWVSSDHFAAGPFRWAAYDEAGGELIAASSDFYLPSEVKQFVLVDISFAADTE